jgi:hypothetical protein
VSLQTFKDAFGAVELERVGTEFLPPALVAERLNTVALVATQVAEEYGRVVAAVEAGGGKPNRRRFFVVRCGRCGEFFVRSSGPNGYGGTSTWKGRCPTCGNKKMDEDEMIGEAG